MVAGEPYASQLAQGMAELPAGATVADLFDYRPAREWVARRAFDASQWERLRNAPGSELEPDLDAQVLSTLTEAWVHGTGETRTGSAGLSPEEFRATVRRSLAKVWARFSHGVGRALAAAEAKKDAELAAKLMKDYLDGQRKLKEFSNFYEEA
jgi:hypothetical protein